MTKCAIVLVGVMLFASCSTVQKGVTFTAADVASAAKISTAAGMPLDAQCWKDFGVMLTAIEQQLANGAGGLASVIAVQRGNKAIAGRPECEGIMLELVAALSKIPYVGGPALMVFGF